ncbi:hypothetical protein PUNSTDRAFT_130479 [Punctularia strigosozonata HHB-11173 SS5]|uniref:uncharacterized protein n=1 Tax=Punctularia strigosozonata (strain HHB-11173) TaxID=741275 RepID=UPI0004416CF3|nr:uncharacterized protein PUNSTDRAFT_130479 [Punctularia strigosozonata HHB-11173 SS5]EIN12209.1 hypothetical protein PUNSTDRAFT_130479 [Punctularia strigosozonata HHB-11173 SS5]
MVHHKSAKSGLALALWHYIPRRIRLLVYQGLVAIGLGLYPPTSSPKCFRLPFGLYAKVGRTATLEAQALQLIAQYTDARVPRLVDALPSANGSFVVMTAIDGIPLRGRLNAMTAEEVASLASDLKASFDQVRTIPRIPPSAAVCGPDGGPFYCPRVDHSPVGPFATEKDFYAYLISKSHLPHQPRLKAIAEKVHNTQHPLCLSHNDLHPLNILVDDRNRLAGIVDWEGAAWMPDYWDYTRAHYGPENYAAWHTLLDQVFGSQPNELCVERELWKYNDPW